MTDWRSLAVKLVEDERVDIQYMLLSCLKYMSQDEVRDMLNINIDPIVFERGDYEIE